MTFGHILLLLVLIGLNAFFVSVEFAAVTSRRARLDILYDANSRAARMVRGWLENPAARDRLIAATQLGITMVSLALGAAGENAFEAWLAPYFEHIPLPPSFAILETVLPVLPVVISLAIVTSFHVVLGEQVPKVAVLRSPEKFAVISAPVMNVFGKVFKWFIDMLDWATRGVLALAGLPASSPHTSVYSPEEIKQIISGPEVEGVIEKPEREMLSAIIDFGELVVRQVAVPRTEIIAIEADADARQIISLAAGHGITKLPVYEENLDHVLGVVHLRDVLKLVNENLDGGPPDETALRRTAREMARETLFVPETISVNDLLLQFRARRTHLAMVLDEYGGTAGLVTLEDLLEEIVGDVQGPFDLTPPAFETLPDGTALVDGLVLIEEINEHFGLHLADPNYDTIAGYFLGKLGRIPEVGDEIEDAENGIKLKVETMDRLRIERLALSKL